MRLSNQNNQVGDFIKDQFFGNNEKKKKRLLTRAEDFNSHFNRNNYRLKILDIEKSSVLRIKTVLMTLRDYKQHTLKILQCSS